MAKPIKIEIIGDAKKFNATVDSVGSKLGGFGKLAGGAIAAGAIGAGAALFEIGSKFDEASNTIRVGTGATGDQLAALEDSFKKVAGSVPASFGDASTAIADINTRLGLTGEPLEALSGQFLNLSRITGTDVAGNVDRITRVFGDWNVAAEDQSTTMDLLFKASQNSGIGIDKLGSSLVQFGAPLRNVGFSLAGSTALLANFDKAGVNTETVVAGLRAGVGKLAKSGEDVPATFSRVVKEIEALGPSSEATAKAIELFGQRSGPDLADAIAGGKFSIDEMLATIAGSNETINSAAADSESFGDKWQKIKNQVFVGLEPAASGIFDAIAGGMETIGPLVGTATAAIGGFFAALTSGQTEDEGTSVELFALQVRDVVLPIISDLKTFVTESLVPALQSLGAFIVDEVLPRWLELAGFMSETVLPVFQDIATFVIEEIIPRFQDLVAQVAESLQPTLAALAEFWEVTLKPALEIVVTYIREAVIPVWLKIIDTVIDKVIPTLLEDLIPAFLSMVNTVAEKVLPVLSGIVGVIVDDVVPAISTFIEWIGDVITKAGDFKDDVTGAFDTVVETITGMPGKVSTAAAGMFDGIRDAFRSALNWIIDRWNGLRFSLPSVEFLGQTIGGNSFGVPQISRFNTGTTSAPGGLAFVGERGRELVHLPRGSQVTPAHRSTGGGDINVYVERTNASPHQIGQEVAWALRTAGI